MPAGHLAHHFGRRLIVDAFVGDRRRLRGALDNDTLDALVDGATRVVRNRIRGGHRLIAVPKLLPLLPIRTAANFLFCYLFVILDP